METKTPLPPIVKRDETVFCVDDSATIRSTLMLSLMGMFRTVKVENGAETGFREALRAAITGEPYSIFIFDIEMPKMDGFELALRIRQVTAYRDTPILFLSGTRDPDKIARAREFGSPVLSKDSILELRRMVAEALEGLFSVGTR